MSQCSTQAAPASESGTIEVPAEQAVPLVFDDPSVVALIAEIDAILCAAAQRLGCWPPAPPAIGCALSRPRCAGRSWQEAVRSWRPPVYGIEAVQRGPPAARNHAGNTPRQKYQGKGGDVITAKISGPARRLGHTVGAVATPGG